MNYLALITTLCFSSLAFAQDDLRLAVEESVATRLGADTQVNVSKVAARGKLPATYTLELRSDPKTQQKLKLLVRDSKGSGVAWVDAEVEILVPVVVLTRDAERGNTLETSVEVRPIREAPRDRINPDALQEAVAARNLRSGAILSTRDVKRENLVERTQPVTLRARRGGVTVTQRAIALQHGSRGDIVRVRTAANQTVEAIVVAHATCEVP